jgi:hypothetical protein
MDTVLEEWKNGRIRHPQADRRRPGQGDALRHTIEVYSAGKNRKGLPIELAVREWASRDARVASVVEEVDAERVTCAGRLFERLGVAPAEAAARSVLLYAYVFGFSLMRCNRFLPDSSAAKAWITNRIAN